MNSDKGHLLDTRPNGVPVERGVEREFKSMSEVRRIATQAPGMLAEQYNLMKRQRDALRRKNAELRKALEMVGRYPTGSLLYGWVNEKGIGKDEWDRRSHVVQTVRDALKD